MTSAAAAVRVRLASFCCIPIGATWAVHAAEKHGELSANRGRLRVRLNLEEPPLRRSTSLLIPSKRASRHLSRTSPPAVGTRL